MADSKPDRDQQQEKPDRASPGSRRSPRANGHSGPPESAGDPARPSSGAGQSTPDQKNLAELQTQLDLDTGKAHLRRIKAAARLAEAKADAAKHQSDQARHCAAAEPERQETTRWERTTRLNLEVTKTWMVFGVAVGFLAIQVVALIVNPWLSPASLLVALLGLLAKHLLATDKQEQQPEERGPDP